MCAKKKTELLLKLDENSKTPLYLQIYEQLKDAVMMGRLVEGDRLVSIRKLSSDLGVSHTTVEQAYMQLAVEGFVINVPRSGYVVAHVDVEYFKLVQKSDSSQADVLSFVRDQRAFFAENRAGGDSRFDFSYANLQSDSFPVKEWRSAIDAVLYSNVAPQFARYSYTDEPCDLQVQLAGLLARTRGVSCIPEQVVLQAGTGDALQTIFQLFDRDKHVVGVEDPGYATVREVADRQGFSVVPLPVEQGTEAFLDALEAHKPKIVFMTPSHQFPTGRMLGIDDRTTILKWAERNNVYIIEDDSCNEYRYDTRPVPSLQSLDAFNRVIYLGNVSKVLSPSMRIAYCVLPPKLIRRYWRLFNFAHPVVPWLEQAVLARFIASGSWDAHVRKMSKGNHRRHDELYRCLIEYLGDIVGVSGVQSGMHLYVTVRNGMSEQELLQSALEQGAKVYGVDRMRICDPMASASVMIGFSAIAFEKIEPGVRALAKAWR